MGQATFLRHSHVLVQECNKVRLTLITGGLTIPTFHLAADQYCPVSHHRGPKLALLTCSRPRAWKALPVKHDRPVWKVMGAKLYSITIARAPVFLQAPAHSMAESPSTIGLLRWLQPSPCTNPNTNMEAAQEGRAGHCKQTRLWQDVTQIYLHRP